MSDSFPTGSFEPLVLKKKLITFGDTWCLLRVYNIMLGIRLVKVSLA